MSDAAGIDKFLNDTHEESIASLCDLLRIPSITVEQSRAADMRAAADWVRNYLANIGVRAEIWPTAGWPAVFGAVGAVDPAAPTILIYGHYDVQPTGDLSKWTTPPFQPRVDATGRIFARGSADNKGQFFLQIRAVEAWMKTAAAPPVNIRLLIEGEEEIGSPNLAPLLRDRREQLKCDLVVVSDTPLWRPNRPAVSLGTRGITGLEVRIVGPNRDLHSGIFGGSIPNPIGVLSRMLARLHDNDLRIAIPHFYDDVRSIPEDLRREWKALEPDVAQEETDLACRFAGERGFSPLEQRWLRPTIEFNGITGGHQGSGSNTIVPSIASAKITCRLVPDQDPDRIQSLVADYLRSICPPTVRIELLTRKSGARPYSIDSAHPALWAARRVLRDVYGVDPVRVREGLSLPILPMFRDILGAETALLGFCDPACNAHSFDEFFDAPDLLRGSMTAARFFDAIRSVLR